MAARRIWGLDPGNRFTANHVKMRPKQVPSLCLSEWGPDISRSPPCAPRPGGTGRASGHFPRPQPLLFAPPACDTRSPPRRAAGMKCARRFCARRHLNCTHRLPKLRTPYRTLHTCSVLKVQYGVHNSRILSTPKTTAQPSVPLHGEPACPPPSSVGRGRLPQRQF